VIVVVVIVMVVVVVVDVVCMLLSQVARWSDEAGKSHSALSE